MMFIFEDGDEIDLNCSIVGDSKLFKKDISAEYWITDEADEEVDKLRMLTTFILENCRKVEVLSVMFSTNYTKDDLCLITMTVFGIRKEVK